MEATLYIPKHIREENAKKATILTEGYFTIVSAKYDNKVGVVKFHVREYFYGTRSFYLDLLCVDQEAFEKLKTELDQSKTWLILYKGDNSIMRLLPRETPALCTII